MLKPLPIGKHTFVDIRHENMMYVDKTAYLHHMITRGSAYFLSRPRRFGKSLTLSTLDAIFSGKRELFDGLAIAETDYTWEKHPIIRLDMSKMEVDSPENLKIALLLNLDAIATDYHISLDRRGGLQTTFATVIKDLHAKYGKVVVLIDEYDKPIISHMTDIPLAISMRDTLRDFYTILKASDEYLRFVLLTGVSKFSKAGVFSQLNHLSDLTMDRAYAALCGYTQEELEFYFVEHITALAKYENLSLSEIQDKIKHWYNGYHFCENAPGIYNPFSTLLLFEQKKFKDYWFETGTPKFLIDLIKHTQYNLENIEKTPVLESAFSTYELESLNISALLFQTGYLTIADYRDDRMLYQLSFPNFEVKQSFFTYILHAYTDDPVFSGGPLWALIDALYANNLTLFFETLKTFFAKIPYTIQIDREPYYQTIFYVIFTLLKLKISAEVCTNTGRIDALIETPTTLYLFEFKLFSIASPQKKGGKKSPFWTLSETEPFKAPLFFDTATAVAKKALTQIDEKGYAFPFLDSEKTIQKVGVAFSTTHRNIVEWTTSAENK